MPNFTGVMARPRFTSSCSALNDAMRVRRASKSLEVRRSSQIGAQALGVAHRLAVRRGLLGNVEVALAQRRGIQPEERGDPAEDVLDHEHALRAAEAAERGLRRLVRLRDATLCDEVRDPVRVVDVAEARPMTGSERSRLQPPSAVSVVASAMMRPSSSNPGRPGRVERMPLAGHREVLRAVEAQAHRAPREHGAERGDRREDRAAASPCPEAAAHPQALHRDAVRRQAQHVRHDLLRLGRVLRARLDEDLPLGVDAREGGMRLEVEVLLSARRR
jgi:hypothetical protein